MSFYIAYGSNLNMAQMAERCPGARPAGAGELRGYKLAFRGAKRGYYLTLLPEPEGSVPVGVWEVTEGDLLSLDQYEGYPEFYYKTEIELDFQEINTGRPRRERALIYIMREEYGPGAPTEEYYEGCLEGFRSFGLDTGGLERAYREVIQARN